MEKIKIYGLYTNANDTIRYVGKTKRTLNYRLSCHLSGVKKNNFKRHKDNWIKKALKNGNQIKILLLEECDELNWKEREIFWIKKLKNKNNLTNCTMGGEMGKPTKYKWSYNKLKKYIQKNFIKIKSSSLYKEEFKKNKNLNKNIPSHPNVVYKKRGWISWGDFLGTNRLQSNKVAINKYEDYNKAKKIIQSMKIKSSKEYCLFYKSGKVPNSIPLKPARFYLKRGWVSWGEFLGTNKIANKYKKNTFYTFEECKKILNNNFRNINSKVKFYKFIKGNLQNSKIPSNPQLVYSSKWISWGDFLGTNKISDNKKHQMYLNYDECKKYIQRNHPEIKSSVQWGRFWSYNAKPENIPLHPDFSYKKSGTWIGWGSFLNTNNIINSKKSKNFLTYHDFINYFKENKIKITSAKNYTYFFKNNIRPFFITASPDVIYRGRGWVSWGSFLNSIKN